MISTKVMSINDEHDDENGVDGGDVDNVIGDIC